MKLNLGKAWRVLSTRGGGNKASLSVSCSSSTNANPNGMSSWPLRRHLRLAPDHLVAITLSRNSSLEERRCVIFHHGTNGDTKIFEIQGAQGLTEASTCEDEAAYPAEPNRESACAPTVASESSPEGQLGQPTLSLRDEQRANSCNVSQPIFSTF